MKIDMKGMNVVVTGASRGIGRAIALGLGSAGASVAVHFRENEALAVELAGDVGNGSQAFQADLGNLDDCSALFADVVNRFGRIHAWINNAGVALKSPEGMDEEEWIANWERTMTVNVTASALFCRLAVEHFKKNGGGRIVNIASRAAFRGDTPEYLAYAASKGAVVSLTRSIARGYGKEGIKAFVVAPGFVRTDMAQEFFDEYGEDFALNDIALPMLTEPQDLAPMVVLLASGMADHATGSTIDINAASYVH